MDCNTASQRESIVKSRWKLLRTAIAKQPLRYDESQFLGYELLPDLQPLSLSAAEYEEVHRQLRVVPTDCYDILGCLEISLLCIVTLEKSCQNITFTVTSPILASIKNDDMSRQLQERCELQYCHVDINSLNCTVSVQFALAWLASSHCFYRLDLENCTVIVRQRKHVRLSLTELTSHHSDSKSNSGNDDGQDTKCGIATGPIDNTGNIRIWDCERTLTWLLQETISDIGLGDDFSVIELGAGMAGIAALSLTGRANKIIVTDGNKKCVQNNKASIRMMQCLNLPTKTVSCAARLLFWATDNMPQNIEQSDITIVSDCTHFVRYHSALLCTLIACTKIGGHILMCQPDRGDTLRAFMRLVEKMMSNTVIEFDYITFDEIEQRHQDFMGRDRKYDANIHKPIILHLIKLRQLSNQDVNDINSIVQT